jgi:hypothetical protein
VQWDLDTVGKMSPTNVRLRPLICIVWILALTIFGFLAFLSSTLLVFSWFSVNRFFYLGRFGAKYPSADQLIAHPPQDTRLADTTYHRYDQSLNHTAAESDSQDAAGD